MKNTWQTILQEKHLQDPKCETTSILRHNREASLEAYHSGDGVQQEQMSHFIDNHHPKINIPSLQITQ